MTLGRAPDVVVVGGGIVGTATAAFLAEAGARVTLVEATDIAAGASGRNSGVIQQPFDPALVGLYRRSLELYRELAVAVHDAFRLDDEPSGLLCIGPEDATDSARELVAAWAATYPEAAPELLAGEALTALEPGLADGLVACRLRIGYPAAPASATRAYAALAERHGARIARGSAALVSERERRGTAGVVVDGRSIPADVVVVAAGPWSPAVVEQARPHLPIGRSWGLVGAIGLDRPPRHVLEEIDIDIEPDDKADDDADGLGFDFSLVTADGASALGSTFLPEPPAEADAIGRLRERGARYVPAIATAPLLGTRVCARPVTPDGRPLIGRLPDVANAYVAAGHGPWGISTGPGSARLIADVVLGRASDVPAALDAARFGRFGQRVPVPG